LKHFSSQTTAAARGNYPPPTFVRVTAPSDQAAF
jgi:hypothetical protein